MKQSSLVGLLKETIDKKEAIIKEYEYYQDPNIDVKKEILATLNKDIYTLVKGSDEYKKLLIEKCNDVKELIEAVDSLKEEIDKVINSKTDKTC